MTRTITEAGTNTSVRAWENITLRVGRYRDGAGSSHRVSAISHVPRGPRIQHHTYYTFWLQCLGFPEGNLYTSHRLHSLGITFALVPSTYNFSCLLVEHGIVLSDFQFLFLFCFFCLLLHISVARWSFAL